MQSIRRSALNTTYKACISVPRQPRRFAHDEHAHNHSHEPVNESLGTGFWVAMGFIPASWALYYASRTSDPNAPSLFTRLIDKYTEAQEKLIEKNDLHVQMVERAGADRALFANTPTDGQYEMRFPEIMNSSSPFNIVAGSQVNLDKVIAKNQKEAREDYEQKLEALRTGNIPSEKKFEKFRGIRRGEENDE